MAVGCAGAVEHGCLSTRITEIQIKDFGGLKIFGSKFVPCPLSFLS